VRADGLQAAAHGAHGRAGDLDAVKRYLLYKGFDVKWVVNITDVDDKLIDSAKEEKSAVEALAAKYTKDYFDCLALMGIDTIDQTPKASEHIGEIIAMSQRLIEQGYAYRSMERLVRRD